MSDFESPDRWLELSEATPDAEERAERVVTDWRESVEALAAMGYESARLELGDSPEDRLHKRDIRRTIIPRLLEQGITLGDIATALGVEKGIIENDLDVLRKRATTDDDRARLRIRNPPSPEALSALRIQIYEFLASELAQGRRPTPAEVTAYIVMEEEQDVSLTVEWLNSMYHRVGNIVTKLRRDHPELRH